MVFQKIKKVLISPRTIISLIIITLIACVIGFLIPQITDKSPSYFELWKEKNIYTYRFVDRLQLNRVYTSFWFLTLVLITTASLGYSIYLQFKNNIRQVREHKAHKEKHKTFTDSDKIIKIFKKRRYRLSGLYDEISSPGISGQLEPEASLHSRKLIFTKNSTGRWGGIVFHLGLLLVIVSAIAVLCLQKKGFVQLMEGEVFDGKEDNFLVKNRGVLAGEFNTGFNTHLSRLTHTYWEDGRVKFLESSIAAINDRGAINKKLSINNPLSTGNTTIYQSNDYGYTLSFILKRFLGEEILTHFNIDRAGNIKDPAIGKSNFPKTPYVFKMKFLPDISNKSFYLTKPILYLTIFEADNIVFNGLVIPGDAVKIKEDVLHFMDVRYWSGLIFVNNPGIPFAYTGFAIGILGAVAMFLIPYKEIHLSLDIDGRVHDITGITKRYHALFKEEMEMIKDELKIDEYEAAPNRQQSLLRENG